MQQLLSIQTVPPTPVPPQAPAPSPTDVTNELWNLFQPFLHQQFQLAEQQHEQHVQNLKKAMESRFRDTNNDIKAIKGHLLTTTGTAPPTVLYIDELHADNAKKGEKIKEWVKKGIENGLYLDTENDAMLRDIPLPDGSKKVDVTQNALDNVVISVKKDRAAKDLARWNEENRAFMKLNAQGCSGEKDDQNPVPKGNLTRKVRKPKSTPSSLQKHTPKPPPKSHQHQTSTQTVVTTTALTSSHTTSTHTTTTAILPLKTTSPPSPPAKKQKTTDVTTSAVMTTVVETPVVSTTVSQSQTTATHITPTDPPKTSSAFPKIKRRKVVISDDDSPSPPPKASKSQALVTTSKPIPPSSAQMYKPLPPAGVQFPLELVTVREEIKSFYYEDNPTKRSLPSIEGYPRPTNIEEYLKIKAKQAEDISIKNKQGKSDREYQQNYQFLLTQVKALEQFAKNVCQQISERADESLRKDYIENIMTYKTYKGEKHLYRNWIIPELEKEVARIHEMIKNKVKQQPLRNSKGLKLIRL
ncbi:hypothetical protein Hanom_Chr12g01166321 [Helianthus anomalus]